MNIVFAHALGDAIRNCRLHISSRHVLQKPWKKTDSLHPLLYRLLDERPQKELTVAGFSNDVFLRTEIQTRFQLDSGHYGNGALTKQQNGR